MMQLQSSGSHVRAALVCEQQTGDVYMQPRKLAAPVLYVVATVTSAGGQTSRSSASECTMLTIPTLHVARL
jgi:hypothetical protein